MRSAGRPITARTGSSAAASRARARSWRTAGRSAEAETDGFSESLAYELASQNITVKLIEPSGGVSSTDFGKRMSAERTQTTLLADYDRFITRTNAAFANMSAKRMATADTVAQVIYHVATDGTNQLRYFCGEDTGGLAKAKREMSDEKFMEFMRSRFAP